MVERKHHLAAIPKIASCEYTVSSLKERSLSGAREGRTISPQLLGVRSWPVRMLSEDQEGSARSEALTGRGASGTRSHGRCTTAMPPTIGSMAGGHGQSKTPSVLHLLCVSAGR